LGIASFFVSRVLLTGMGPLFILLDDFWKIYWGYDVSKEPFIFDGIPEKAKSLLVNVNKSYNAYLNSYINQIQSFDDEGYTHLINVILDAATAGIYSFVRGIQVDSFGYVSSIFAETGWTDTTSKAIMERREVAIKDVNRILEELQPKKYKDAGSGSYPSDELRERLVRDMEARVGKEYSMASRTGVEMPFNGPSKAIAHLKPLIDDLVETHIQLWNGLTNRTVTGEETESTGATRSKTPSEASKRAVEVAGAAAAARLANESANIKAKLRDILNGIPGAQEDHERWYEWLAGFVDTLKELEMVDPVLQKWFATEQEQTLEEGKFILPGSTKTYKNFVKFVKKNSGFVVGNPIKDLFALDRLLDLVSSKKRDRRKAKRYAKKLRKAAELGERAKEKEKAGKKKKAVKLTKRAEKVRKRVKKKELKEIIEDEVRKVLDA
jgi:hypothetical protein